MPLSQGQNIELMEQIVADQRQLFMDVYNISDDRTHGTDCCGPTSALHGCLQHIGRHDYYPGLDIMYGPVFLAETTMY